MNWFVMLNMANGWITPLVDDNGVAMFETYQEAKKAAHDNLLGRAYGAIVFNTLDDGHDV
jgi:hypothetical protein